MRCDGTVLEGDGYAHLEAITAPGGRDSRKLDEGDRAEGKQEEEKSAHETLHCHCSRRRKDGLGSGIPPLVTLFQDREHEVQENDAQDAPNQPRDIHCLLLVAKPR